MLQSLEIQGFKSFPEYTKILFHSGITAIVGPNGAGKSNITDAIRWVLGEQSAKTLRGQRMEDVIFNGTAQRRPVSFSEVTLTFDNSKQILPIDYETVSITRRYYRSGDSEYLINKTPCRLKDVNALLMDTGIGLDGYSIIGQGRVDEILSNKSEDRRAIFEEASGIVQFRTRKDEALRKLNRSEQNLLRVDDLLAELESQAETLEKQAYDARHHIELATRYRKLDIALSLRQVETLEAQREKRQEDARLIEKDLEQAKRAQQTMRSDESEASFKIDEIDRSIEEQQTRFNQYSVKETEHIGLSALHKEKYESSKEGAESLLEEKNRLTMRVMSSEQDLSERKMRREAMAEKKTTLAAQLLVINEALSQMEASMGRVASKIEEATRQGQESNDQLASYRALINEKQGESQALSARLLRLKDEENSIALEKERAEQTADTYKADILSLKEAIATLEQQAQEAKEQTLRGHRDADRIEQTMEMVAREIHQLNYEAETLERLESDFEGFTRPVQLLMKEVNREQDHAVYGPLASLLTVPEALRPAIETALGGSTHHVVVDDSDTAKHWIDWLRNARAGRATFLPLGALSPYALDQRTKKTAEESPGFIGVAGELVSYDPEIDPAVRYVLGRTLVVETMDDAVRLSQKIGRSQTVVTRGGDVVNRGGSMTGGYRTTKAVGVLGRPGRAKAAREEADEKKIQLEKESTALEEAKELLTQRAKKEESSLMALADQKAKLGAVLAKEEAEKLSYERLLKEMEQRDSELLAIEERLAELSTEKTHFVQQIDAIETKKQDAMSVLTSLQSEHTSDRQAYEERRHEHTRLEVSIASLDESLLEFDRVTKNTGTEIEEAKVRQGSLEREWKEQTARMERARQDIEANDLALAAVSKQRRECQTLLEQLMEQREEAFTSQRALIGEMNTVNDQVASLQAVCERQDAELERMASQVDDQLNRLWETHGVTRREAEAECETIDVISKATSERARLKREIDELGPINHNAIRDYEALSTRIDFTRSQREDIEKAQSDLEAVLRDLDQSMREQFNRTFHEINQNFNQVFSELFSGGQAELTLEGDGDVLSADISIQAQPPGKKLQKLSLLSGGERCLTAIALLFSILKLKPAPFCVFDEVESALDDANVKRFTDYVRRYAWSMQFILVTHRKGTMEASDRLYGVTMQERGISRVLSMVLSSALPYGD